MKLISWNINSINSRISHLKDYIREYNPDIILLQETKCTNENFPREELEDLGYQIILNGQKSYNGVAILSKYRIEEFITTFPENPDDSQARYIEAVINVNGNVIRVASVYVPNGGEVGSDKYHYKLEFLSKLKTHIKNILSWKEKFIIAGDFNVAASDIDVYDARQMKNATCFSSEEKKAFYRILNLGIMDSFRILYPETQGFTWWDYRAGSWQNDNGMRIDYILCSPQIIDDLENIEIHKEERGKTRPSDHVPLFAKFKI